MLLLLLFLPLLQGLSIGGRAPSFWELMPAESIWKNIMSSFVDDIQVKQYVNTYAAPFSQLQAACRNDAVSPDMIRSSLLSVIDYYEDSLARFNISSDSFQNIKSSRSIMPVHNIAAGLNADPLFVQRVGSTFSKDALISWLRQRFEDMVIGSPTYPVYTDERFKFKIGLSAWREHINGLSSAQIRHVIRTTEDIGEVQRREVKYILSFRKQKAGDEFDIYYQIRMLGNSTFSKIARHKPYFAAGFSILVTAILL